MRIVYMGTPDFAAAPLKALIGAGHEVVLAVTQEDRPSGRGKQLKAPPVKEAALEAGIRVLQPKRMRDPEFIAELKAAEAELFVVAAFGRILPEEILKIPPRGCVNIHASLLPAYRGAAPIQRAILDGQAETGITTMLMDAGLDTGDILRQYRVPILPEDTGGSLFDRMTALGAEAILDTIQGLLAGEITPVKQGEATTPYAAMLKKEDGRADWSLDAVVLERQVRGLYPWPGTYTFLGGRTVKLMRAGVIPEEEANACFPADAAPGTIAAPGGTRLLVRCGKGALEILELQQEGKKRMQAGDWLRGARLEAGARFEIS